MDQGSYPHLLVLTPLLLQLVGLTFAVFTDRHVHRKNKILLLIIVLMNAVLIASDYLEFIYSTSGMPAERLFASVVGYCVRPIVLLLFVYVVGEIRQYWPLWTLIGLNAAIHLTAFFSSVCFTITPENHFIRGPLGYTCHVVSGILLVCLTWITLRGSRKGHRSEIWIPLLSAVLIVAAVVADSVLSYGILPVSFLTIALTSATLFFYIWLHMQFVREHEIERETEQRIQIMMSQIQPHFLFNTLSTIQALCRIDPEKASDTVEKFGTYLRQNLESLDRTDLIPFEKELEHVRLYADIEQIRFPSIKVEYKIEDSDFELPALSIQPLVENAIRHGVRIRENGRITIRSWRDIDAHYITITDNGTGFDVSKLETADSSHIGIRNVRERIKKMCGGTFDIASEIGKGTSVTVKIPIEGGTL